MSVQQKALDTFLHKVSRLIVKQPAVFLSYSWPVDEPTKKALHLFLKQLADYLRAAGAASVFLDIEKMNDVIRDKMTQNVAASDIFIAVCSKRMKERGEDETTNVYTELSEALKNAHKLKIIPLLYEEGGVDATVPAIIKPFFSNIVDVSHHHSNNSSDNSHVKIIVRDLLGKVFEIAAEKKGEFEELRSSVLERLHAVSAT